jgi:toxin ParE1/3/4
MQKRRIVFTSSAERDLFQIISYIEEHDSASRAHYVLEKLAALISTLDEEPERGSMVRELVTLGNKEFRQLVWKPYRVIYQQRSSGVFVHLITDGRRDMQTLLEQRLLS